MSNFKDILQKEVKLAMIATNRAITLRFVYDAGNSYGSTFNSLLVPEPTNETQLFHCLHELGHIVHKHHLKKLENVTKLENDIEADSYANSILIKHGFVPFMNPKTLCIIALYKKHQLVVANIAESYWYEESNDGEDFTLLDFQTMMKITNKTKVFEKLQLYLPQRETLTVALQYSVN